MAGGAARGEDLVLTAEDGNRLAAYIAYSEEPRGAQVVILPDVRGLHQFYKDLAIHFAEQGIRALAIDYFGRTAGLTARDDSFEYMPHVEKMQFAGTLADVRAALDRLHAGDGASDATFTLGFCMGGSLALMTGTEDLGLGGIISFYASLSRDRGGAGTVLERAMAIKYPVLALFGGADVAIPLDQVETFDRELDKTGIEHTIVTYAGAPHSFFDKRQEDFADASSDAWTRVLEFIADHSSARVGAV